MVFTLYCFLDNDYKLGILESESYHIYMFFHLQESILDKMSGAIVTLELHGTVFFLSSTVVLGKILSHLNLLDDEEGGKSESEITEARKGSDGSVMELSPLLSQTKGNCYDEEKSPARSDSSGVAVKYLILDCERLQVRTQYLHVYRYLSVHATFVLCSGH